MWQKKEYSGAVSHRLLWSKSRQASTNDWEKQNQPLNKRKAARKNRAETILVHVNCFYFFIAVVVYNYY